MARRRAAETARCRSLLGHCRRAARAGAQAPAVAGSPAVSPFVVAWRAATAPAPATAGVYQPSMEEMQGAEKFARFAVSALQFEDVATAVKNLQNALRALTGGG